MYGRMSIKSRVVSGAGVVFALTAQFPLVGAATALAVKTDAAAVVAAASQTKTLSPAWARLAHEFEQRPDLGGSVFHAAQYLIGKQPGSPRLRDAIADLAKVHGDAWADVAKAQQTYQAELDKSSASVHALFAKASTAADYSAVQTAYERLFQAGLKNKWQAQVNCGEAYLAQGNFTHGFKLREARLQASLENPDAVRLIKPWAGQDLRGKKLIVRREGGIGDAVMFPIRCAKKLKEMGAIIIFEGNKAEQALFELVQQSGDRIVAPNSCGASEYDYDVWGMSLLHHLLPTDVTPATIPAELAQPYLEGLSTLVKQWRSNIDEKPGLHIAYAFQASPQPAGVCRVLDRNIDAALLEKTLASIPEATLYCLQDRYTPPHNVVNVCAKEGQPGHKPFHDTVALMQALKESGCGVVVSVDTSVLNLAGAVGVPTIALLPKVADWRWGTDETTSCFFPLMQLLRQTRQGEWGPVLKDLHDCLRRKSLNVQMRLYGLNS